MNRRGFTLLEIILVMAILASAALIAMPAASSHRGGERKLELAAAEVADALRYARAESLRTGEPHGLYASVGEQRILVYRLDISGPQTIAYFIRQPLDKKIYNLRFGADPAWSGIEVTGASFLFRGLASSMDYLDFESSGAPVYIDTDRAYFMSTAEIGLSCQGEHRTVRVSPIVGRVTVE